MKINGKDECVTQWNGTVTCGGRPLVLEEISITTNGDYIVDESDEYDAFGPVHVHVSYPKYGLTGTVTKNGIYDMSPYSYDRVVVDVDVSEFSALYVSGNGNYHNPVPYSIVDVNVNNNYDGLMDFLGGRHNYPSGLYSDEKCSYVRMFGLYNTGITSLYIPNIISAGVGAFEYCDGLTDAGPMNIFSSVPERCFNNCNNLSSFSFKDNMQIGSRCFTDCGFTELTVNNTYDLGYNAFGDCRNISVIHFEGYPYGMANYVFSNCKNLQRIDGYVSPYLTGIGTFTDCVNLSDIGDMCNAIHIEYSYFNNTGLSSVVFSNLESVLNNVFANCRSLYDIRLDVCSYIFDSAFCSCQNLQIVYLLSESVVTLQHRDAFYECNSLTSIFVPESLYYSYVNDTNWTYFSDKIVSYYG